MSVINLSPKQEETAEVIFKLTNKFNFPPTLDEIAAEMGITKGTLQYHMTALRKKHVITWNPGAARSVRIIDTLCMDGLKEKHGFKKKKQTGSANSSSDEFLVEDRKAHIPILGKIAAGLPLSVMDKTDEFLELDSYFPDGCYALRVKGESMVDAFISDGDLVLIEPRDIAHNGEIVVALVNNDGATLKRFFKEKDGRIRLQPENPSMDPIYVETHEDLRIQGIVKGVIRRV